MQRISGTVDFRDEQFIVSCQFDSRVHAQLRALPRYQYDQGVWLIPCQLRSVADLMGLARQQDWPLTQHAEQALAELRAASEQAEYRVELVDGPVGEPWFKCHADDPELEDLLAGLPGAAADDEPNTWIVPGTSAEAFEQVLALVDNDPRFDVDRGARRLLDTPEDWPELVRGEVEEDLAVPSAVEASAPARKTVHDITAAFEREQELLAWSSALIAEVAAGPLEAKLRPYQSAGVRYLRSARQSFLADDKGLGKSVQALAAIEAEAAYPALILCAGALELQWEREVLLWLGHQRSCTIVDASTGTLPETEIVIVNYELLYKRRGELKARGFRSIVADDSHLLKSERSLKTRAALEIAEAVPGLRFCLSSKVLLEQPIDLLPQLLFLGRIDDLQGRNAFVERYCRPRHDVTGTRYGASHIAELEQRLRASCLCRRELSQLSKLTFPLRYTHVVRTKCTVAEREREATLMSELGTLRDRAAEAVDLAVREEGDQKVQLCLAELRLLAARSKVDGIADWIDHFMVSGEWLAVVVHTPELLTALERRYPDAVIVRAHGACVQAGVPVNSFFVADEKLVFVEEGSAGAALRMARGRHVAHAEPGASASSLAMADFLIDTKYGERAGAVWELVSDMAADQALRLASWPAAGNTSDEGREHVEAASGGRAQNG